MTAEDFVDVRLTAAGEAAAGKGESACVRVHGSNYQYAFAPGKIVRVAAAEFRARLAETRIDGAQIFEIVKPGAKKSAGNGSGK
jgi:hypothetical protein